MIEVTIKAAQRVAGLVPGAVVTVEKTDRIEKLIAQGRVEVVDADGRAIDQDPLPTGSFAPADDPADAAATGLAAAQADAQEQASASGRRKKPTGDAG
ncbi:hypothetical protein KNV19_gp25 [Gordonia phage Portcullis]|uniref:Uncharacterized protein n=1 Tax=Gordonia phage Portcullis TaxID=2762414 RepID=A0A7G8LGG7_9CAUD|nr:hypothetical protein KNV19_gp25 [Gordonia phage Portcullis]QNJ56339.1 hypothetical protein SEA_PORTCULLIS_25 [Gordonia phage Portcullis]